MKVTGKKIEKIIEKKDWDDSDKLEFLFQTEVKNFWWDKLDIGNLIEDYLRTFVKEGKLPLLAKYDFAEKYANLYDYLNWHFRNFDIDDLKISSKKYLERILDKVEAFTYYVYVKKGRSGNAEHFKTKEEAIESFLSQVNTQKEYMVIGIMEGIESKDLVDNYFINEVGNPYIAINQH